MNGGCSVGQGRIGFGGEKETRRCCMSRLPSWQKKNVSKRLEVRSSASRVRRDVQYSVEASGLGDLLWEIFVIPVQC